MKDQHEALVAWSYNRGYEHAEANLPPNRFREVESAGDIGTYAHALFEWHLHSKIGPEPDPGTILQPAYLTSDNIERGHNAYRQAVNWLDQTGLFVVSLEQHLVSERYRYGGTPDGITERNDKLGLADWKTSRRLYANYLLQTAGYWILWEENHPKQPIEDGVHIVRFSKEKGDFFHYHFDELDSEKQQFLRLREVYDDDSRLRGRV